MSLVIPDAVIVNTLNLGLNAIRSDYRDRVDEGQEERSFLYEVLSGKSLGKYDFYANAKEILITFPEDNKHIDVKLSHDHNTTRKEPIVYVTLPSENSKNDSLSIGEGDQSEILYDNGDGEQDEYKKQYNRRYNCVYQVIIVCENRNEMLILYHVLKALLISCINHFNFEGLQNMKIGGGSLGIQTEAPDKAFVRALTLNFEYETLVPEIAWRSVYQKLRLYWSVDDTAPQGPITFDSEDSF